MPIYIYKCLINIIKKNKGKLQKEAHERYRNQKSEKKARERYKVFLKK